MSASLLADPCHHGMVDQPILAEHIVFVAWDAVRYHAYALAPAQVVELHGMKSPL
ncbi:hypothetical protein ACWENQ_04680 [Nonomuraea sp. NPDC004354]